MNQVRFFLLVVALCMLLACNGVESLSKAQKECIEGCESDGNNGQSPACGSNGVTYTSSCHLMCEQKTGTKVLKKSDGKCPRPRMCECWRNTFSSSKPLCDHYNKEHQGPCAAHCAAAMIDHDGNCVGEPRGRE